MEAQSSENFPIQNIRCVRKFAQLTDTTVPENKNIAACLGNWYHSYLPNDFRNFLFLFRNNQLPLNNRINAFDDTVDPRCTFCRIIDNNTASRDGLSHVFRTCIVTDRLIAQLITKLEPIPDPNSIEFKHMYWYGSLPENPQLTRISYWFLIPSDMYSGNTNYVGKYRTLMRYSVKSASSSA